MPGWHTVTDIVAGKGMTQLLHHEKSKHCTLFSSETYLPWETAVWQTKPPPWLPISCNLAAAACPVAETCRKADTHLVEDMIIALRISNVDYPGSLQQVCANGCAWDAAILVELYFRKLSKARWVVIPDSLGIAKSFKQWVWLQHLKLIASQQWCSETMQVRIPAS